MLRFCCLSRSVIGICWGCYMAHQWILLLISCCGIITNAEASVEDTFVDHLCPLGPEFLLSVLRLSALTTRGRFSGTPLTYYLFSRLLKMGPELWFYLPMPCMPCFTYCCLRVLYLPGGTTLVFICLYHV